MKTIDYSKLPRHMQDSARAYVEHGVGPEGFLYAVLTNDLVESIAKADIHNREAIVEWASWLYNEAPMSSWGTPKRVEDWIERGGMRDGDKQ